MDLERVIEQAHGILGIAGVPFTMNEDKTSFLVGFGSARLMLVFRHYNESVVVSVRAFVLEEVDVSGDREQRIYERLNDLNGESFFGKLYLQEPGTIVLEYDLLGDELDAKELLHAVSTISGMADALDDSLSTEFGTGMRAEDIARRSQGQGSGPVVPA
jgi:T3SS (YopN, CesT) and YbjN peptide-binding chaperone 1